MKKIRITSGELKGRVIASPEVAGTHPMGAREKIALFNMVGDLTGVRVLDAYAGSGALGIEALSRGASGVVFVEKSPRVAKVIRENLAKLGLTERAKVIVSDVGSLDAGRADDDKISTDFGQKSAKNSKKWAQKSANRPNLAKFGPFGVILADPPYDGFQATEVANLAKFLVPGGVLALSHPGVGGEAPELAGLVLLKSHSYARANISNYKKKDV